MKVFYNYVRLFNKSLTVLISLKAKIKTICYFCLPETWKQFDKKSEGKGNRRTSKLKVSITILRSKM